MKIKKEIIFSCASSTMTLALGYLIGKSLSKPKIQTCGNLRMDNSEENEPVKMFLEVTDQSSLMSSEYVVFKVIKEPYLSHKF